MKKIAMFCDNGRKFGGIYQHCIALKNLLEQTNNYKVYLFDKISYRKIWRLRIYNEKQLKLILTSENFDYIHIHGFITYLPYQVLKVLKKLKLNKTIIHTPHMHPFCTLNHPIINRFFYFFFVKPVLKKADKVITLNNEDYLFMKKICKHVYKIPHWYVNDYVKLQNEKKKNTILFVGRNDSNKNLAALYQIDTEKYHVICVTNEKPKNEYFKFYKDISTKDLIKLYSEASLTVIPSRYEAFSYVALESLVQGTPILVSDRVRIIDYLNDVNGVTVYNYKDNNNLYEKIDEAMHKTVDVEKVKNLFSDTTALRNYEQIFE